MDRGPLALFGAIVAVGLGPALWMGVQLGAVGGGSPARPPVVSEQGAAEKTGQDLLGGSGAGEQADTNPATEPRGHIIPLTTSPSAEPSPSASAEPEPSPSTTSPSTEPTATTSTPSDPPTESTTEPTSEPTETTEPPIDDETVPPSPPGDDEPEASGSHPGYVGERSAK
ncbi:hypothetical protein Aab01nite_72190 [Paractinoplanes abujensis]|uniref:Cytoskeletal protein RodZ n=1 Tax=Paractinoplanes abujensis TaxID=882441 RepID=A0A7W7G445_9ACTN|nr:hypothetical protein [Actinoplanes abujensis]MBB4694900.1 cytoskeletal protein RodZ [Actinoplanes abujensis]GID23629.1 hypothetical protein Aab01nite_72190 [Actinoplanes abujensis]